MRRLSGPLVELQRRDSPSSRGWLKEANEQEGKKKNTGVERTGIIKSMNIQRKYDNYQWEVSVWQEWRDKQIEMKMVEENVNAIGEIIIMAVKKRTTGMRKHSFIWFAEILALKAEKKGLEYPWASHCCDLWAHYCFTANIPIALSLYWSQHYRHLFSPCIWFHSQLSFLFL